MWSVLSILWYILRLFLEVGVFNVYLIRMWILCVRNTGFFYKGLLYSCPVILLKSVYIFTNFYCLISLWDRPTNIFPIKRNLSNLFCKLGACFVRNIQIQHCFYFPIIILLQSLNHGFIPDDTFFALILLFQQYYSLLVLSFPFHLQSFSTIMF